MTIKDFKVGQEAFAVLDRREGHEKTQIEIVVSVGTESVKTIPKSWDNPRTKIMP